MSKTIDQTFNIDIKGIRMHGMWIIKFDFVTKNQFL